MTEAFISSPEHSKNKLQPNSVLEENHFSGKEAIGIVPMYH